MKLIMHLALLSAVPRESSCTWPFFLPSHIRVSLLEMISKNKNLVLKGSNTSKPPLFLQFMGNSCDTFRWKIMFEQLYSVSLHHLEIWSLMEISNYLELFFVMIIGNLGRCGTNMFVSHTLSDLVESDCNQNFQKHYSANYLCRS